MLVAAVGPAAAQAASLTVSGVVYYDRSDNGVREAGVPGTRVRHGGDHGVTTTDRFVAFRLTGLPATGKVLVETIRCLERTPPREKHHRIDG